MITLKTKIRKWFSYQWYGLTFFVILGTIIILVKAIHSQAPKDITLVLFMIFGSGLTLYMILRILRGFDTLELLDDRVEYYDTIYRKKVVRFEQIQSIEIIRRFGADMIMITLKDDQIFWIHNVYETLHYKIYEALEAKIQALKTSTESFPS